MRWREELVQKVKKVFEAGAGMKKPRQGCCRGCWGLSFSNATTWLGRQGARFVLAGGRRGIIAVGIGVSVGVSSGGHNAGIHSGAGAIVCACGIADEAGFLVHDGHGAVEGGVFTIATARIGGLWAAAFLGTKESTNTLPEAGGIGGVLGAAAAFAIRSGAPGRFGGVIVLCGRSIIAVGVAASLGGIGFVRIVRCGTSCARGVVGFFPRIGVRASAGIIPRVAARSSITGLAATFTGDGCFAPSACGWNGSFDVVSLRVSGTSDRDYCSVCCDRIVATCLGTLINVGCFSSVVAAFERACADVFVSSSSTVSRGGRSGWRAAVRTWSWGW